MKKKTPYTPIATARLEELKRLIPEAFTEGKVHWQKLKDLLKPHLADTDRERYSLGWVGKHAAYQSLQQAPTHTLAPCKKESLHPDTSEHIFIEGENLETLKIIEKSYRGRIKMIYIDPPYNTGKEFIYHDRFQQKLDDYHQNNGTIDEDGKKNYEEPMEKNTKENGHHHSNWLSMMYPRLFIARTLLREDGVIFVSIDDNEVHNLRLMMDELFGEENFVANVIWEKNFAPKNDNKYISNSHDYILVYAKEKSLFNRNLLPRIEKYNSRYENSDNDFRGLWTSGTMLATSFNESGVFPIKRPNGTTIYPPKGRCWRYSQSKVAELLNDNRIWFGKNGSNVPRIKRFLVEMPKGIVPQSLWKYSEVGSSQNATQTLKKLFEDTQLFSFPKPVGLLKRMLQLATSPKEDDLVLDFFAGSGTTAQAVMELNAEDGGQRKYICVQLPESCDEKSEAYQAGYKHIAAIARERIRRASAKIAKEHPGYKGDLGFKAFKQVPSHLLHWDSDIKDEQFLIEQIRQYQQTSLKPATAKSDLLYELLLDRGFPLTSSITYHKQASIYQVIHPYQQDHTLFLLEKVDDTTLDKLLVWQPKPSKIFILDDIFTGRDSLKTNISLQLRDADITFESA